MGIFLSLIALSLLILIHEWGHYHFAKKNGVKVLEFAIGFPPKVFSYVRKGTRFAINLIPFGGYVKLYGEDSHDQKLRNNKESFVSKSIWQKTQIILAGVLMNFLVFWVLSSIAFTMGVSPMLKSLDDLQNVLIGGSMRASITMQPVVDLGSKAQEYSDLVGQDLSLNQDGDIYWGGSRLKNANPNSLNSFGLKPYPVVSLPTMHVESVSSDSVFASILKPSDKVLQINGLNVFDYNTLDKLLHTSEKLSLLVLREGRYLDLQLLKSPSGLVVLDLAQDSVVQENQLRPGDRVTKIDGRSIYNLDEFKDYAVANPSKVVELEVYHNGIPKLINLSLSDKGQLGVYFTRQFNWGDLGLNFWLDAHPFFLEVVQKERYPFYIAPFVALQQAPGFASQTVTVFLSSLKDIFVSAEVSENVGGPLKVVSMGSFVLEQGVADFLNFIAIISLSLAVLNILPIPALDGGRFLFIMIEAITKKPLNPKFEAIMHLLGFVILMGFIIMVTIFDIIRF